MRDLMMQFESLGSDCEFGTVRHYHKVASPGLFKGSGMDVRPLTLALAARLAGLGDPEFVQIRLEAGEYVAYDLRFGWRYHTGRKEGELSSGALRELECRRLRFLAAKLLEDMTNADKIFVYKRESPRPSFEAEILPLHRVLRQYGPNFLLWVALADDQHPAGTIEMRGAGVMLGYLDRFLDNSLTPDPVARVIDGWTNLCIEARRLRQEHSFWGWSLEYGS